MGEMTLIEVLRRIAGLSPDSEAASRLSGLACGRVLESVDPAGRRRTRCRVTSVGDTTCDLGWEGHAPDPEGHAERSSYSYGRLLGLLESGAMREVPVYCRRPGPG